MRIIGLSASNVKKLHTVDLTPNEYINRISGANGSGKTSILDAIEWALTGTSNVASQPVRKGAGKAVIQLDLGDIVVTRRFFEGGNKNGVLALESKSNKSRYQSPQQLLDSLMGKISFDPLEFLRMPSKKQFEVLQGLVKVDVNLDDLKAAYDRDYLRRREAKKERDSEEVRRNAIAVPDKLPREKVDEAALVKELQEASSYNEEITRQQRTRSDEDEEIAKVATDAERKRNRAKELRAQADAIDSEAATDEDLLKKLRRRRKAASHCRSRGMPPDSPRRSPRPERPITASTAADSATATPRPSTGSMRRLSS